MLLGGVVSAVERGSDIQLLVEKCGDFKKLHAFGKEIAARSRVKKGCQIFDFGACIILPFKINRLMF